MKLSPLDCTDSRTTSGLTCHHIPWKTLMSEEIERGLTLWPLDRMHCFTMSDVACDYRPWNAHKYGRFWEWHAIIAIGKDR